MKLLIFFVSMIFLTKGPQFLGAASKPDPDQLVLEQLKKAGSDLSKLHKIEFFLYFPSQSAAMKAAHTVKQAEFEVDVRAAAQGPAWLCLATKHMVPKLADLQKIRRQFNSIAAAQGGEYDGWGTEIVK
jgi:regulator of RNase E activity RraB